MPQPLGPVEATGGGSGVTLLQTEVVAGEIAKLLEEAAPLLRTAAAAVGITAFGAWVGDHLPSAQTLADSYNAGMGASGPLPGLVPGGYSPDAVNGLSPRATDANGRVNASGQQATRQTATKVKMPNGTELPAPGKGKGSVDPKDRDPKRTATKSQKEKMLDQRGNKCEGCDKPATADDVQAHHLERHADGGATKPAEMVNLCKDCHTYIHKQ